MLINVVTVKNGWILHKIAERIVAANTSATKLVLSEKVDDSADANFYVDISNCYRRKSSTIDVGLFTHLHENDISYFPLEKRNIDYILCMSSRYAKQLSTVYPKDKIEVVFPAEIPSNCKMKKPTLGIFQRGFVKGKGFDFLVSLAKEDLLKHFKFFFIGSGWKEVFLQFRKNRIDIMWISNEKYEEYLKFYNKIDYLLVPSLWEGGPMALVEALALGIPVISADVGWVNHDLMVDHVFVPGDVKGLLSILNSIYQVQVRRRQQVENWSFSTYANCLIQIVKKLKGV